MKTLTIHPDDNVAVALEAGSVPIGHKMALKDIAEGQHVIKYGFPIGHATRDITAGEHVHTHNLKTNLSGTLEYNYQPQFAPPPPPREGSFMGYRRPDGTVGIRNEIWIIPTVGCVNKTADSLARLADERFGKVCDGFFAYPHPFGCSQMGDDQRTTQALLAALVRHPNAAGVLVLGLGCENNNLEQFLPFLGDFDRDRVRFLVTQDVTDELETGLALLSELAEYAAKQKREPVPLSALKIGLKCGGSDGFSGITANPLVGHISDRLISYGGTAVLSEVPEMFGAETLLMNRCVNREVFEQTVALVNGFKDYYTRHGQVVYENPSPGNKEGGISTLEDKSLGCTQKGGQGLVTAVVPLGGQAVTPGLNLLEGPGNDLVAITNLTAAGAHLILFTTGRGTPVGAPVPTVKLSSNSTLAAHKPNWIDFDAGRLLTGTCMDDLTDALWTQVLAICEGKPCQNEIHHYREISLFKDGVVL